MLRFECDEKGASTGICSGIELLERLHATTYSFRRFSCLLRRCRLGTLRVHRSRRIERLTVNIAPRAAKSKKKPSG